ncbi:uncharacterized protein LOC130788625 [Actinidia eriantha]|uniref:uncharacterized protein LOC130788625 n=1 Tax=Actinidia eriantha TaxID=165200 RepID=UPI002588AF09|nr:uncharacterized protein LOC130788625 [Actinidia eriantha]
MDREQEEMQFLGLFGIYKESYKIIFSWRKIFSKITLALILPLSFIFLAHIEISELLFWKILHTEIQLDRTPVGTRRYEKLSDVMSEERINYWLFKIAYFTFLLIFSLLSTSAVVYTIASIYTAREVTFRKVMSVVPKVWKRLMVTFLCTFATFFLYNLVTVLILFMWVVTIAYTSVGSVAFIIIVILYAIGFVYLSIVWQLASVVTVLEETYGFRAMIKSKDLIKGKMWIGIIIFFKLNLSLLAIQILFERLVVRGWSISVLGRVGFGMLCLLLLFMLFLFGLVIQTVIYFVCKSYHHENIDKSTLSDHLEVYLGEYEPLKAKDVQLEQVNV